MSERTYEIISDTTGEQIERITESELLLMRTAPELRTALGDAIKLINELSPYEDRGEEEQERIIKLRETYIED